jgi:hypothetical protein
MGNAISSVIEERENKNETTMKDALDVLKKMAEFKYEIFIKDVESNSDKTKIPVDQRLYYNKKIVCSVEVKSDEIGKEIKSTLESFAKGNIIDGICNVVEIGLKGFLGQMSIGATENDQMMLILGTDGDILRLDYKMFGYVYNDESLRKVAKNVLMVCYTVHSVDLANVHVQTVLGLLHSSYPESTEQEKELKADVVINVLMNMLLIEKDDGNKKLLIFNIKRYAKHLKDEEAKDRLSDLEEIINIDKKNIKLF